MRSPPPAIGSLTPSTSSFLSTPPGNEAPRLRVVALILLGYGYLAAILIVLAAILGFLVFAAVTLPTRGIAAQVLLKLGLPLLGFGALILRVLWVRIPAPDGVRLEPFGVPRLAELTEEVRKRIAGPRVHEIRLTLDLNASVTQVPRLGVLGWNRNYLSVGLPLLYSLTVDEFRAVLAHEVGHLAGSHGRFAAWVYRLRTSWSRLMERLDDDQHWGMGLLRRFVNWYAPLFSAESFAVARQQELAADRSAQDVAGASAAAHALVRLEIANAYLGQSFWPAIFRGVNSTSEPPVGVLASMAEGASSQISADFAQAAVTRALSRSSDVLDTHPSLRDRLDALGELDHLPPLPMTSPAASLLGASELALRNQLEERWLTEVAPSWRERYEETSRARARLAELDQVRSARGLSLEERLEYASTLENLGDEAAAVNVLEELHREAPDNGLVRLGLGRLVLGSSPERAVGLLEDVSHEPGELGWAAASVLANHYASLGDTVTAEQWSSRAHASALELQAARRERGQVRFDETYLAPDLPSEQLEALRTELRARPEVRRAYLLRKEVRHFADQPMYVLAVRVRLGWLTLQTAAKEMDVVRELVRRPAMPAEWIVVPLIPENRPLEAIARRIAGSEVFRRNSRGVEVAPRIRTSWDLSWIRLWIARLAVMAFVLAAIASAVEPLLAGTNFKARQLQKEGVALSVEDNLPEAERRLRRALEIDASFDAARRDLALVLWKDGRFDEAVGLMRTVVRTLDDADSWRALGLSLLYAGKLEEALKAFDRSFELDRGKLFVAIWRSLAAERAGEASREALRVHVGGTDLRSWPGPVVRFLLGEVDAAWLVDEAKHGDPATSMKRLCEAFFYAGEVARREGRHDEARTFFEQSFATDVRSYVEWAAARLELSRLKTGDGT